MKSDVRRTSGQTCDLLAGCWRIGFCGTAGKRKLAKTAWVSVSGLYSRFRMFLK